MSQRPIAVTSISFAANPTLMQELAGQSSAIVSNHAGIKLSGDALATFINQNKAEIAVVGTEPIDARLLSQCPQLKLIAKYGVGLDNIDLEALNRLGIGLGWTPGVNKRCVSELTLAFMLGHCRNVFLTNERMKEGNWFKNGGTQLSGKSVGIVGLGNVGQDLATLLKPFGVDLYFHDIADRSLEGKSLGATPLGYRELLSHCSIVSFHVPGGAATKHLFGSKELSLVSPDTLIINTARGSVVEFPAVIAALRERRLGGYAADVFSEEPFNASPYRDVTGLYVTPHIGGNAREAVLAMGRSAIHHVSEYLVGRSPQAFHGKG